MNSFECKCPKVSLIKYPGLAISLSWCVLFVSVEEILWIFNPFIIWASILRVCVVSNTFFTIDNLVPSISWCESVIELISASVSSSTVSFGFIDNLMWTMNSFEFSSCNSLIKNPEFVVSLRVYFPSPWETLFTCNPCLTSASISSEVLGMSKAFLIINNILSSISCFVSKIPLISPSVKFIDPDSLGVISKSILIINNSDSNSTFGILFIS